MKISEQWLREWVNPKLDTRALAQRLTMAGLEVGAIEPVAPRLEQVVVGEIVAVTPHPEATRLQLCTVDVGQDKPLNIVCGAANAAIGLKVPTALVGAVLPGDRHIERVAVRGVTSAGMLCAAAELGLGDAAAEGETPGLLILGADARPGVSISDYLGLHDHAIEIDLTPNRGDCLSIAGIAREVAALTGARFKTLAVGTARTARTRVMKVNLKAPQDCPRYVGRVIEGIDVHAQTPLWMRERLRRCGLRCIHPVVDVTNYVLLELGQPMHAFDLDKLAGDISVRRARAGETLTLLDGNEVRLTPDVLVIADRAHALALAGVMGGMDSAVGAPTSNVFLESAYFAPQAIAGPARAMGLHTDSSHRFERGVDPALQWVALERATALLLAIAGGRAGAVVESRAQRYLPKRAPIVLRRARIARVLGMEPPVKTVERILTQLGMTPRRGTGGWRVVPPTYRFDIEREVDLIEEVARVNGYERVPSRAPRAAMTAGAVPETRIEDRRFRDLLVARDYQEVITYSFVDPALQELLTRGTPAVILSNPIASDMAALRTSLWPALLQALDYNWKRQHRRIRLFEIGRRFLPEGAGAREEAVIGAVMTGSALPEQWGEKSRHIDFFDAKADVEALFALGGVRSAPEFRSVAHPALHPGQAAEIRLAGVPAGLLGVLHPAIQHQLDLEQPVVLYELNLDALRNTELPVAHPVSRVPAIRRDLAVVVDEAVPAGQVLELVTRTAGNALIKLELFDVYRGEGIDSRRKSLAFGLTLQDSSRTLRDEEVEGILGKVVLALQTQLGAQLRN